MNLKLSAKICGALLSAFLAFLALAFITGCAESEDEKWEVEGTVVDVMIAEKNVGIRGHNFPIVYRTTRVVFNDRVDLFVEQAVYSLKTTLGKKVRIFLSGDHIKHFKVIDETAGCVEKPNFG
uniref:DUF3221 domain-containing protein n=1 Tax=Candidatus Giovannonibacteria bacterium GW2011_GWF2_42_19 TaxID=1618659 RepID=A0A0G1BM91_9BACT|nr:MAG: hypothetical protein UV11_C0016G0006 [Candidatus Giovannonibacteria bacterium GW2011_GWF2_42_19]